MKPSFLPCCVALVILLCSCGRHDPAKAQVSNQKDKGVASPTWRVLCPGVEFANLPAPGAERKEMQVVRVDASKVELVLLSASKLGHEALTAEQWAKKYGLLAVINAGMFDTDHVTHTGYMKDGDVVKPDAVKKDYSSVAAFAPLGKDSLGFRMFDLEDAEIVKDIAPRYGKVIQNLRLIKRPRENRWRQQPKQWSEAALGEDATGHVLLMFSRVPASMHDFNEHMLKLPIDLVAAQHLEGGPEASLYVSVEKFVFAGVGSYETGFMENDNNHEFWPLPNVIGVRERTQAAAAGGH